MGQGDLGFILKKSWRFIFTFTLPLVLSVLFLWGGKDLNEKGQKNVPPPPELQPRGAFVVLLIAGYWISECIPLAVTALVPIFLIPWLGIASSDVVASKYLNQSVLLLAGGCIVAQAFEYSNLHSRIALKVATLVGAKPARLLFGIMMTAMFLSMWMNNTSTTSMMFPIVEVITEEFAAATGGNAVADDPGPKPTQPIVSNVEKVEPETETQPEPEHEENQFAAPETQTEPSSTRSSITGKLLQKRSKNIKTMFLLGIAYASNIGGTGIITGTATNLIAVEAIAKFEPRSCLKGFYEFTFGDWVKYNAVPMLISTLLTWAFLVIWFTGFPKFRKKLTPAEKNLKDALHQVTRNVESAIRAKYDQLGKITFHEVQVAFLFLVLVCFWITGKLGKQGSGPNATDPGWHFAFSETDKNGALKPFPHDSVPACVICVLLVFLPKDLKYYKDFMNGGLARGMADPVLPWREIESKVPWGPLVLIGGGFALSVAITESGLGAFIGSTLANIKAPKEVILLLILAVVCSLTSIASNTATASILSVILLKLADKLEFHPLYFVIPATISASYAFVLPISTPPNAIVFGKSDMKMLDMAAPGIIVQIMCNAVLFAMIVSYEDYLFGYSSYPKPPCDR